MKGTIRARASLVGAVALVALVAACGDGRAIATNEPPIPPDDRRNRGFASNLTIFRLGPGVSAHHEGVPAGGDHIFVRLYQDTVFPVV